ncbi:MAG TPA: Ig-like domain repeat protein, partial [Chitinophagaceae bacterium]|nr:Ig-like domain repeat protein [Chitinophagaceae bacterium]
LLPPQSIDGGAQLQVTMTDNGEPGTYDAIAITVWNKNGGLWFASNWDGTISGEQILAGGNLKINSGAANPGTIGNTVALTSSLNPSMSGQAVTFRATIVENNAATPTGYVVFIDGTTVMGTVAVSTVSNVTSAAFTISTLTARSHTIKAYYSGDAKFGSSVITLIQNVSTSLTSTRHPSTSQTSEAEYAAVFDVVASPNPTNHLFNITVQSNNAVDKILVRTVDVLGRVVENRNSVIPGQTFKLGENYRPGIYWVEIIQGKERRTLRLIKQPE